MRFTVGKIVDRFTYPVFDISIKEDDEESKQRIDIEITDLNEDEVQELVDKINEATGVDLV